jgi:hypothetical protein
MKYFVLLAMAAGFCFMVSLTFLPIIVRPRNHAHVNEPDERQLLFDVRGLWGCAVVLRR